jgi:putative cell wall-binding protein
MRKPSRVIAFAVLTVGMIAAAPPVWAQPTLLDGNPKTTERLGSDDPVETALAVSAARFVGGDAEQVVLARDDIFADSLAGAPLSDFGPLLLTAPDTLPASVRAEIDRVLPTGGRVYLLGGQQAVSSAVESQLRDAGYEVTRLFGASRVETAVAVAQEVRRLNPDGTEVALARADEWADSVTGGAWAALYGVPLLVTASTELHPAVAQALRGLGAHELFVLGGRSAISDEVESDALGQMPRGPDGWRTSERLAGANRADTALAVAEQFGDEFGRLPHQMLLINGYADNGWAFGLAAAGLAADLGVPLLVADTDRLPPETAFALDGCQAAHVDVLVIGGRSLIGSAAQHAADCDDDRFLCDVFTGADLDALLGERREMSLDVESAELEGYAGLCEWTGEEWRFLRAVHAPGRELYDETRAAAEEQGVTAEPVEGFEGDAYRVVDEIRVLYAVYDGTTTWMITFLDVTDGVGEGDVAFVEQLMHTLIERRA